MKEFGKYLKLLGFLGTPVETPCLDVNVLLWFVGSKWFASAESRLDIDAHGIGLNGDMAIPNKPKNNAKK